MAFSDEHAPLPDLFDEAELVNSLISRKQQGESVDGDILVLLLDLERVGLTDTEAYRALEAHRLASKP